jgi:hypothetical protein
MCVSVAAVMGGLFAVFAVPILGAIDVVTDGAGVREGLGGALLLVLIAPLTFLVGALFGAALGIVVGSPVTAYVTCANRSRPLVVIERDIRLVVASVTAALAVGITVAGATAPSQDSALQSLLATGAVSLCLIGFGQVGACIVARWFAKAAAW